MHFQLCIYSRVATPENPEHKITVFGKLLVMHLPSGNNIDSESRQPSLLISIF